MKQRVTLDFETRSACDLKKSGAYKYSLDPSTQPTCLAFKTRNSEVKLLDFKTINKKWGTLPALFELLWEDFIAKDFEFVAHNAFFETVIYKNILVKRYGWPDIPFTSFRCTAAKAAACALPRGLEGAGAAMELSTQKDHRGYNAMMATCKPTRQWNAWTKARLEKAAGKKIGLKKQHLITLPEPPKFLEPEADPNTWAVLYRYCKIDVKTEELLDDSLPDLTTDEQEIWFLNQEMNWNGFRVDIPLIQKIVSIMATENVAKLKELDTLTMGLVTKPGARQSILEFLRLEGIELPDIRAKTIEDTLKKDDLPLEMRRLLEIRKALSKTSTKKYQAFLDRAGTDHRVRDILLYCGASTGRDAGTGINPQNFPRGLIRVDPARPYANVENVAKADPEMLKILYGDSLAILFSALLRNMIIPSEGCELFVADFSKIEVAVLWWLADNWPGLEILNSGRDPYKYQAAANTGKTYEEISDSGDERQLGKAQILGAGFRMGWKRFKETAYDQYRLTLTNRQSFDAIKKYREANPPVVELWDAFEDAAISAVENPGTVVKAGKCAFKYHGKFLWIKLPSGRKLAYLKPRIIWRAITYSALEIDKKGNEIVVERTGAIKKTLQHLGLDITKKNMQVEFKHGGIWTENIVQAIARDLMKNGERELKKKKYQALLVVHDEVIGETQIGAGTVKEFTETMCMRPNWVDEHLPLEAKGWKEMRYRK